MALQFSFTSGRFLRLLQSWMARAMSSLPVPVSPKIRTVESRGATRSAFSSTSRNAALLPIIFPEVLLRADFFAQIDVFFFQLRVEGADFFIRFHVLHGERNLIGHFLQELSIRNRVLIGFVAGKVQGSNTLARDDQRSDANRTYSLLRKQPLGGRFTLLIEIVTDQRPLIVKRPTGMAVSPVELSALQRRTPKRTSSFWAKIRRVSRSGTYRVIAERLKRQDALQRRADGAQ